MVRGDIFTMSLDPKIRRLRPDDADSLVSLRREALERHPLAFGASIDDDGGLSLEFVRASLADDEEQAVFGHFAGGTLSGTLAGTLAGMVGVMRVSGAKRRHRSLIWGMYVAPHARKKGVGRALLDAAIAHARAWPAVDQLHLSVTDAAVTARTLYEAAGFRFWGREPRALQWEGRFVDEIHLVLDLRAGRRARCDQDSPRTD